MRIVQITDLHVSSKGEDVKGGVDTRTNLLKLLKTVSQIEYDFVVLTGDICLNHPNEEAYKWVKEQLVASIDYSRLRIIPGNHDHGLLLATHMEVSHFLKGEEIYFRETISGRDFIFLDTGTGESSQDQKGWLKRQLADWPHASVEIFMHYPPFMCGVPFMDQNHFLRDMDDFQEIFQKFSQLQFRIFCGHYHVERSLTFNNVQVFITPSAYVQIHPDLPNFEPDHHQIGFRVIDLNDLGIMTTEIRYIREY